jgi:hypothetical protein
MSSKTPTKEIRATEEAFSITENFSNKNFSFFGNIFGLFGSGFAYLFESRYHPDLDSQNCKDFLGFFHEFDGIRLHFLSSSWFAFFEGVFLFFSFLYVILYMYLVLDLHSDRIKYCGIG